MASMVFWRISTPDKRCTGETAERQLVAVSVPELAGCQRAVADIQRRIVNRIIVFVEVARSGIVAAVTGPVLVPDAPAA